MKNNNFIKNNIFHINKPAGHLRRVLVVLLFIIYWYLSAYILSLFQIDFIGKGLFDPVKNIENQLVSLVIENFQPFFSPFALISIVTFLLIFLLTRNSLGNSIIRFFPQIHWPQLKKHLNHIAFSKPREIRFSQADVLENPGTQNLLSNLGGPANLHFHSSNQILVFLTKENQIEIIDCPIEDVKSVFLPPHTKLLKIIPSNQMIRTLYLTDEKTKTVPLISKRISVQYQVRENAEHYHPSLLLFHGLIQNNFEKLDRIIVALTKRFVGAIAKLQRTTKKDVFFRSYPSYDRKDGVLHRSHNRNYMAILRKKPFFRKHNRRNYAHDIYWEGSRQPISFDTIGGLEKELENYVNTYFSENFSYFPLDIKIQRIG